MTETVTLSVVGSADEVKTALNKFVVSGTGTGTGTGDGGSGGTTTPPDTNVYPLPMPDGVALGANVDVGVGPKVIAVDVWKSGDPVITDESTNKGSFVLLIDGVAVGGPFVISASSLRNVPQRFSVRGSWDDGPHRITLETGGLYEGITNVSIMGVYFNYVQIPLIEASGQTSGGYTGIGDYVVWDNKGVTLTFGYPPPTSTGTGTGESGGTGTGTTSVPADIVSDGKTLEELVAATPADGTLVLPAGTFHGAAVVRVPMTIRGAGMGNTIVTGVGFTIPNQKGLLNGAANIVVEDLTLAFAKVPDENGAGIRMEPNCNLTATRVEFSNNENGILTAAGTGTVALVDCNLHDNGGMPGKTHDIYMGQVENFSMSGCRVTSGSKGTHSVKSRAKATTISNCVLKGSTDQTGDIAGSVVDISEGGDLSLADTTIELMSVGNILFFGYAMEGIGSGVKSPALTNVALIDHSGTGGYFSTRTGAFTADGSSTDLTIGEGCTYVGTKSPQFSGWKNVVGSFSAVT